MRHLHIVVRGRVQGVGFRWYVRERARSLGVAGWVRNLPDGSVELAANGPGELLSRLRAAVERGPQGAMVESIDDLPDVAGALPSPFTIQR